MSADKDNGSLTLSPDDIGFITYFIRRYMKNFGKGKISEAHHDATAILLYLAPLLGENDNPYTEP